MGSKGRCESASAVRPAAFHASGPIEAEWSWRKRQLGTVLGRHLSQQPRLCMLQPSTAQRVTTRLRFIQCALCDDPM